jgi:hypothetical protein
MLYKDRYNSLWLNVTEMARLYVEAIDTIAKDVPSHLSYIPSPSSAEEEVFLAAFDSIEHDITDFCKLGGLVELSVSGGPLPLQADWLKRLTLRND